MFKRGLDSIPKPVKSTSGDRRVFDFYLGYNERAQIIFLDEVDTVPSDVVHPLFFDSRQHLITCPRSAGKDCFICEQLDQLGKQPNLPYARSMTFFSVLDLRPYEKDDGTVIPVTKKLLKGNSRTVEMIKRECEEMGVDSLFGSLWSVSRGKDAKPKPAAVGDMYRYQKMADTDALLEQLGGDVDLLKPFTVEELSSVVIMDEDEARDVFGRFMQSRGGASETKASTGFKGAKLNL